MGAEEKGEAGMRDLNIFFLDREEDKIKRASTYVGLVDAGPLHRLGKHTGVASRHVLHAPFLPPEELAVLDQAVLDHLGNTGRLEN